MILEDGTPLRVSFDSHNGYAFSSVERVLIDRHIIARKDISTQAVRDWIAAKSGRSREGARRQPLTPFFIEAQLPIEGRKPTSPFRRLMVVPYWCARSTAMERPGVSGSPARRPAHPRW